MPRTLRHLLLLAAAWAAAAGGCVVSGPPYPPLPPGPVFIEGCEYVYYPGYSCYGCVDRDDWWILEGGVWVHSAVRPARVRITAGVPWVSVDVRGPAPIRVVEEHRRRFPADWKPDHDQGPPPGRGWRK